MRSFALCLACLVACGPSAAVQETGQAARSDPGADRVAPRFDDIAPTGLPSGGPLPHGEAGEHGRFEALSGALTLTLTLAPPDSALEVRLAEIDTPVPAATRARLAAWLHGRELDLVYSGLQRDRYGRALAQLVVRSPSGSVWSDGAGGIAAGDAGASADTVAMPRTWLQYRLVEAGLARVMTHADNHAHADALLAAEARARQAGRGLWADPAHRIRDPDPEARAQDIGTAQIIEGRVLDAVQLESGRIYLNFGRDFTVRIDAEDSAAFIAAGLTPDGLEGQRVRVRGWLVDENGPMIRLDHPARLELLGEDDNASMPR